MKPSTYKIALFVPLILGIALSSIGAKLAIDNLAFLENAIVSEGTVIELVEKTRLEHHDKSFSHGRKQQKTLVYPIIEFYTPSGARGTFTGPSFLAKESNIGMKVEILINPDDETQAEMNTTFELWAAPIVLLIFGVSILIAVAVVLSVLTRRRRN